MANVDGFVSGAFMVSGCRAFVSGDAILMSGQGGGGFTSGEIAAAAISGATFWAASGAGGGYVSGDIMYPGRVVLPVNGNTYIQMGGSYYIVPEDGPYWHFYTQGSPIDITAGGGGSTINLGADGGVKFNIAATLVGAAISSGLRASAYYGCAANGGTSDTSGGKLLIYNTGMTFTNSEGTNVEKRVFMSGDAVITPAFGSLYKGTLVSGNGAVVLYTNTGETLNMDASIVSGYLAALVPGAYKADFLMYANNTSSSNISVQLYKNGAVIASTLQYVGAGMPAHDHNGALSTYHRHALAVSHEHSCPTGTQSNTTDLQGSGNLTTYVTGGTIASEGYRSYALIQTMGCVSLVSGDKITAVISGKLGWSYSDGMLNMYKI